MWKKFVVFISIGLFSMKVYAYKFTDEFNRGFYWGSFPVVMSKIAVDKSEGALLEYIVDRAQQEWEDVVGLDIWDFTNPYILGGNTAVNNIRWSQSFAAETGYDSQSTLAIAIRYHSGTFVSRTEIILNGEMFNLKNNIGNILYTTVLHELGHTIGLGHSDNYAVMGANLSNISSLSADDMNGINAVVTETQSRQATGYISPFISDQKDENLFSSCASIGEMTGTGGNGPESGFFISTLLGFLLAGGIKIGANFASKLILRTSAKFI